MSINFVLLAVGYDILPVEFEAFPVDITQELNYQREYAWNHRDNDSDKIHRFTVDDVGPTWPRGYYTDVLALFYSSKGNVYQRQHLQQMESLEGDLFNLTEYQSSFCQVDESGDCIKPRSLLRYFDCSSFIDVSTVFCDPGYENIPAVLYEAYTHPDTRLDFQYFLGKGYQITPSSASCNLTRSSLFLGWPLEGNGTDQDKQQLVNDFQETSVKPILENALKRYDSNDFKLNYISVMLFSNEVLPQAIKDIMLAGGSLCSILVIMWIQTGSFWITGWAVLSIITSFWITNLVYRTILQYRYFGYFHVISIFIVLGIGADDIFVFYNTWKATYHHSYPSLAHRLSHTLRRSGGNMFYTSLTTMTAFLVGGISPVLPLRSFGFFTGILIAVNYISVLIYFPTVIVMHSLYFDNSCCPCRGGTVEQNSFSLKDNPRGISDPIGVFTTGNRDHKQSASDCRQAKGVVSGQNDTTAARDDKVSADQKAGHLPRSSFPQKKKKKNRLVLFFAGPYFRFVTHKVVRWVILAVFVVFIAFSIWSASRIEPSTEEVRHLCRNLSIHPESGISTHQA